MLEKTLVVIINFNNIEDTLECLESCIKSGINKKQLLLIDNHSSQIVVQNIKNVLPWLSILELPDNMGYAAGVNAGLNEALNRGYEYSFILNNDIVLNSSTLPELISVLERDTQIGICTPQNIVYGTNNVCFAGGYYDHKKGLTLHNTRPLAGPLEVDFLTGSAMLIRNNMLEKTGLFDEQYFLYFEDADFCMKVKHHGFKCVVTPKSEVQHKVSKTAALNPFIYYYCQRNRLQFFARYGRKKYIVLFIYHFFADNLRLIIKGLLKPAKNKNFKNMSYSLLGIMDFIKGKKGKNERL
ncbi:MAG: glycosyltransferase family 2 protein [Candidatus Margulisbacteria bacterium]|nr:glycosyltransferase family 2 protein [Candidatus Margulisiibacteriota bacterium]